MSIPQSTYRLQLNYQFPLKQVNEVVSYLNHLGVSTLYLSPILKARTKSSHCYDVVDPTQLNPELGSPTELEHLSSNLHQLRMSILLDIVPNHMCINSSENSWWNDLLVHGKQSAYANYFDVFWEEVSQANPPQLTLPFLGQTLQEEIAQKHLIINDHSKQISLKYHNQFYPIANTKQLAGDDIFQLLSKQFYCLKQWKEGNKELQYRRFFDVSELACIRVEDVSVFEATHQKIIEWLNKGTIQGLRVDHIDGLNDPSEYLNRIYDKRKDVYIVVEKILIGNETNRKEWKLQGTTGYDFLNELNQLFIYPDSFEKLTSIFNSFTQNTLPLESIIINSKLQIMSEIMIPETQRLARVFHREAPQFSFETCLEAMKAFIAAFPVYRTYFSKNQKNCAEDISIINSALKGAQNIAPHMTPDIWQTIESSFIHPKNFEFISVFQKTTGPIMAKGVEDTALYRFYPLCSMNEVGGELSQENDSTEHFHKNNCYRCTHFPQGLLATSTHDTKRSEDVRARINVLSEIPEKWHTKLFEWNNTNNSKLSIEPEHEYLLYQTLVGTWTTTYSIENYSQRIVDYMIKAVKEEKKVTSWINPNIYYENLLMQFIKDLLSSNSIFLTEIDNFVQSIRIPAYYNSLAQVLLKCTSPGVPDLYQGSELWIYDLVDPDNRRLVDFVTRKKMLALLDEKKPSLAQMIHEIDNGLLKMYVTTTCLSLRNKYPDLYRTGNYVPLQVIGPMKEGVVAFLRSANGVTTITATGRFFSKYSSWEHTQIIIPEEYNSNEGYDHIHKKNVNFNKSSKIEVSELFQQLPLVLMELS